MTKLEAVKHLLRPIRARTIDYDYDPAGSSWSCVPDPDDWAALDALIPNFDAEKDLIFSVGTGGSNSDRYHLTAAARDRLAIE